MNKAILVLCVMLGLVFAVTGCGKKGGEAPPINTEESLGNYEEVEGAAEDAVEEAEEEAEEAK
jgi:predicted small lipoprotein YifL